MAFLDRRDAGCRLAEHLTRLASERPLVMALAPGGVPVAFEIARRLGAPLEIVAVAELDASGEVIGAIAEDGTVAVGADVARRVNVTEDVFDPAFVRTLRELCRTAQRYRGPLTAGSWRCRRCHRRPGRRHGRGDCDAGDGGGWGRVSRPEDRSASWRSVVQAVLTRIRGGSDRAARSRHRHADLGTGTDAATGAGCAAAFAKHARIASGPQRHHADG
jgi:hypothetical protein